MTVGELIEKLRQWPRDAEVRYGIADYCPRTVYGVKRGTVFTDDVITHDPGEEFSHVRVAP